MKGQQITECPIQQVFHKLKLIPGMEEKSQIRAYKTIIQEFYNVVSKHPSPAIPIANLQIIPWFISNYILQPTEDSLVAVFLFAINIALTPANLIVKLQQEENAAIQTMKQQLLDTTFLQGFSTVLINFVEEATQVKERLINTETNLKDLKLQYDALMKQNKKQNQNKDINKAAEESQISNHVPVNQINSQENSMIDEQPKITQQSNENNTRQQMSQTPQPKEQQELSEISGIAPPPVDLQQQIQVVKSQMAEDREQLTKLNVQSTDAVSAIVQFMNLIYNMLTISVDTNNILFLRASEYQLFEIIEMICTLAIEKLDKLIVPCYKVMCAMSISQHGKIFYGTKQEQSNFNSNIVLIVGDKSVNLNEKSAEVKQSQLQVHNPISIDSLRAPRKNRVYLSQFSSTGFQAIKQVQNNNFQAEKLYVDECDYSFIRQKLPQRTNLYDKEIDADGKSHQLKVDGKKTIETTQLPTAFSYIESMQKQTARQQEILQQLIDHILPQFEYPSDEQLISNYRVQCKYPACNKYDQTDDRTLSNSFYAVQMEFFNSCLKFSMQNLIFDQSIIVQFKKVVPQMDKVCDYLSGSNVEYKNYLYELRCCKSAVIESLSLLGSYMEFLSVKYNANQAVIDTKIKTKIAQNKMLENEKMVQMLNLDVNTIRSKLDQIQDEINKLTAENTKIKQFTYDCFELIFNSKLLDMLYQELKEFNLVKYYASFSAQTFVKLTKFLLSFKKGLSVIENEFGLVEIKTTRRVTYDNDNEDDLESDQSESGFLGAVEEDLQDEIQLWDPSTLIMSYMMCTYFIDSWLLTTYSSALYYVGTEKQQTIDHLIEILAFLEQYDPQYQKMAEQCANYENLMLIMHILQSKNKELTDLQKLLMKILDQIHAQGKNEDKIMQFINGLFFVRQFRFRDLITNAQDIQIIKIHKYQDSTGNKQLQENMLQANANIAVNNEIVVEKADKDDFSSSEMQFQRADKQDSDDLSSFQETQKETKKKNLEDDLESSVKEPSIELQNINDVVAETAFTEEEDELLLKNYITLIIQHSQIIGISKMQELLEYKYSNEEIETRFQQLNTNNREWNQFEIDFVKQNKDIVEVGVLANNLQRDKVEVQKMIQQLRRKDKK
ncbi:Conserved_hypothetical protein [Hexamita inflata]|uniref:Uncharacterized protein n=1 Tax=Hexamita inflata TaxID=28002 RepID=A0AA86Q9B9_9EUKA|nr:Conserved hypothetical protein [Hexamita inflata]